METLIVADGPGSTASLVYYVSRSCTVLLPTFALQNKRTWLCAVHFTPHSMTLLLSRVLKCQPYVSTQASHLKKNVYRHVEFGDRTSCLIDVCPFCWIRPCTILQDIFFYKSNNPCIVFFTNIWMCVLKNQCKIDNKMTTAISIAISQNVKHRSTSSLMGHQGIYERQLQINSDVSDVQILS